MASDSGRSLSAGISIPQWMKTKNNDSKFDADDILSPPDNDNSFLYLYPKRVREIQETSSKSVEITENNKESISTFATKESSCPPKEGQRIDYENYTAPCKPFLLNSDNLVRLPQKFGPDQKIKSYGTDDGFKGEAAKCGSSVIKMAHQIVSGKLSRNASDSSLNEEPATAPANADLLKRRNSKSLPASPLTTPNTSPKSKRKMNKYFNSVFVGNEGYQGSWILSSLLKRRDISKSVDQIVEVDEMDSTAGKVPKAVNENGNNPSKLEQKIKSIYVPKPEELREMNFWSPTTM